MSEISTSVSITSDSLPDYVAALPAWINTVVFNFYEHSGRIRTNPNLISELAMTLRKLPRTVTHLELDCEKLNNAFLACSRLQKRELFSSIPDSVQSIKINGLKLGALRVAVAHSLFSALSVNLRELTLAHIDLHQANGRFLTGLPQGLRQLTLRDNSLHEKTAAALAIFFAYTPAWIEILRLPNNQLGAFNRQDLETILSAIRTVKTLDLNDNGLLMLSTPDFQSLLGHLSQTITTIGINDYSVFGLNKTYIKARFSLFPPSIKALTFMSGQLFGWAFSVADFVEVLADLPNSVGEIDLSQNLLLQTEDELIYLVSHLPAFIHTLKLNNNDLARCVFRPDSITDFPSLSG